MVVAHVHVHTLYFALHYGFCGHAIRGSFFNYTFSPGERKKNIPVTKGLLAQLTVFHPPTPPLLPRPPSIYVAIFILNLSLIAAYYVLRTLLIS